ncbi:hypothetical protein K501DRAFT_287436, partial [Backusella circina FSU 941]
MDPIDMYIERLDTSSDNESSSTKPSLVQERGQVAPVTVSQVTTSAELATPSLSNSKMRSVPIPQPLILKRRTSRSSMSSVDDPDSLGKLNTPMFDTNLASPTGSDFNMSSGRRSFLENNNMEYNSSPGSEIDTPHLQQRSPISSPRYASPPAGSGGKYMVRSKRASWIDASSSMSQETSSPCTSVVGMDSKVMKNMPPLALPRPEELKSGSLSKLRKDRQYPPKRENSVETPSASSSADKRLHDEDSEEWSSQQDSPVEKKRSSFHERKASVSSIVTDSSLTSDEISSPMSSPHRYKHGGGSSGHRSASASPLVTHSGKARRRSSMTMLRNIPSSELADIVSGNSPNPILDTPPPPPPSSSSASTTPLSEDVPNYPQQSLQSILINKLTNKHKKITSRASEEDKDVIEMNLDAEPAINTSPPLPPPPSSSSTSISPFDRGHIEEEVEVEEDEANHLDRPVYPAMLLNTPVNQEWVSGPEVSWDLKRDYFSTPSKSTTTTTPNSTGRPSLRPLLTSSSFYGDTSIGSDEDYAKKLFMSRSAKVKRWCSVRVDNMESKVRGHKRSSSSGSVSAVYDKPKPITWAKDDSMMPTIMVTTADNEKSSKIVNMIPWVDWLEEYNVVKAREIRRRSSSQIDSITTLNSHHNEKGKEPESFVHALSGWWNNVKAGADSYSRRPTTSRTAPSTPTAMITSATSTPLIKPKTSIERFFEHFPHHHYLQQQDQHMQSDYSGASSSSSSHDMMKKKETLAEKRQSQELCLDLQDLQHPLQYPNKPTLADTTSLVSTDTPPSTASNKKLPRNPITQKSLAKRVGYRFFNHGNRMGTFGHLNKVLGSYDDSESALQVQQSIKRRLQYAKEACDRELRQIIDGLNEYVERGLQYVEDMDEIIEEGVGSISSIDTEEEENRPHRLDTFIHPLPILPEADETHAEPPCSSSNESNNSLPHKRSLSSAMSEECASTQQQPLGAMILPEETNPHGANAMVALISEDSYLPTPFILTLQDLITLAQNVMDTSLDEILETSGACADAVSRLQEIGSRWDDHPEWPCREWYVRLLLGIAALNRVVEWWGAERGFWNASCGGSTTAASSVPPSDTEQDDMESVSNLSKMDETDDEHMSVDLDYSYHHGPSSIKKDAESVISRDPMVDDEEILENVGSLQLQEEAERSQSSTIIAELSLSSTTVQYLSPVWFDVVGTDPQSLIGYSVARLLSSDDTQVFRAATEELLADDSHTVEARFHVLTTDDNTIEMEGKGMLMYNRVTSEPSHTMWVLKPVISRRFSIVDMSLTPRAEKKSALLGAPSVTHSATATLEAAPAEAMEEEEDEAEESRLVARNRSKSEPAIHTPPIQPMDTSESDEPEGTTSAVPLSNLMTLSPVLCRVCERWVVAAFFEQHSELCVEIHQSEMDVNSCNDSLLELKHMVNDKIESTKQEIQTIEESGGTHPIPEEDESVAERDDDNDSIFGGYLPLDEAIDPRLLKNAEIEILQDLLDIIDVALSISMPGTLEDAVGEDHENSLQSPRSKDKMIQIIYWRPPTTDDLLLSTLVKDVEELTRSKVDIVNRMRDRIEYNGRARAEFQKVTQQEPSWTEFVGSTEEKKHAEATAIAENTEAPSTSAAVAAEKNKNESQRPQNKQSLLKRIRSWRQRRSASGVVGKLSRRLKSIAPAETTPTPIVEMETIDTPIGSPGLRPKVPTKDAVSSGSCTPNSQSTTGMGKSPLSPLHAPIVSRPTFPSIKDFDIIKPISKGAFGSVFLAKKRTTGDYYAIKFLKKSDMIAKNQVTNVKAERMILMSQTDSPFVTKLYYTFQSKDYLYLVLEYLNGGDCSALIKVLGNLPEDWTKNYLAEVTLGLEYLQSKNVIHR